MQGTTTLSVYCRVYTTAFDVASLSCGQQGNPSFLLNDNARPYTALSVKEFLSVHEITLLPHAPYSPDLSHRDFCFILTTETSNETPWLC